MKIFQIKPCQLFDKQIIQEEYFLWFCPIFWIRVKMLEDKSNQEFYQAADNWKRLLIVRIA